jgi:hypothetical protein
MVLLKFIRDMWREKRLSHGVNPITKKVNLDLYLIVSLQLLFLGE